MIVIYFLVLLVVVLNTVGPNYVNTSGILLLLAVKADTIICYSAWFISINYYNNGT